MTLLIICRGIPASGKTTWAKNQIAKHPAWKRVNRDTLRQMLDNNIHKKKDRFVRQVRDFIIISALQEGHTVICDDTNLAEGQIERFQQLLTDHKLDKIRIVVKDFHIDVNEAIQRDLKRPDSVGGGVIRHMFKNYLKTHGKTIERVTPVVKYDVSLPNAIICDLDGTLSDFKTKNHRGPFDASNCDEDDLNLEVAKTVAWASDAGYQILLVSGREQKYQEPTERFLAKHAIPWDRLWMRPEGDFRKDVLIKKEIYHSNIEGKYNILYVLDDRQQTVDGWRQLGLTCFQVAPGDF